MQNKSEIRKQQITIKKRTLKLLKQCDYCGENTKEILQLHHIIPVSKGGSNDFNNLVLLCPNCHIKAHKGIIGADELKEAASISVYKEVSEKQQKENCKKTEWSKFGTFLKGKLAENGLSMRKLAEMLNTSPENLCQKIKRGSISYDDAQEIADLIGYEIEWKRKE